MEWYLSAIKEQYATFSGRAGREEFWMFVLFNIIFAIGATIVDYIVGTAPLLSTIYTIGVIVPSLAVTVRRLHDVDKSGWWYFIGLIPIIGAIWLLILFCTAGTPGENTYGS